MVNNVNGVNPEQVNRMLVDRMTPAYEDLMKATQAEVQAFIEGMVTKWGSPNAQQYFRSVLAPFFNSANESTNKTLRTVYDSVNTAAASAAKAEGGSYSKADFNQNSKKLDASNIKNNLDGYLGATADVESYTTEKLNHILSTAQQALSLLAASVNDSGFADVENLQQEALSSSLKQISDQIEEMVTNAKSEIIKKSREDNEERKRQIQNRANAFSGKN